MAPQGEAAKILALAGTLREIADKIEQHTSVFILDSAERPTRTGASGLPCAGEFALNTPEVATHDVAPPDDGFSVRDEPPSRPA
jgi:hypothetical protein